MDEHLTVTTTDVSENGLSLDLNGHFAITEGSIIRISFIRWQSKTKKVRLNDVPYIVRRIQYWEGVTSLGLERNVLACGEKLNQFFADTIQENKAELMIDHDDQFIIRESALFSDQLAKNTLSMPFYIGTDGDRKRIIQAVGNMANNPSHLLTGFWQAFSEFAGSLSELIRFSISNLNPISDFGVYGYLDSQQRWQVQTDMAFSHVEQKSRFINRALLASQYHFFHCSLAAVKSPSVEQAPDLDQQLSLIRRHSPHHIKQLREVIKSLSGVGSLTDITAIIELAYRQP